MQENHGLYVNITEPIHLMTEVTSVLGSTIKIKRKMDRLNKEFQEVVNFLNEEDKLRECGEFFENNGVCNSTTN